MANHPSGTNYYEILEVAPDAQQHEIHRAYQKAKNTYSQDNPALYSMFSAEEARELLRLVEEAYLVLSNVAHRRTYDEGLSRGQYISASELRSPHNTGAPMMPSYVTTQAQQAAAPAAQPSPAMPTSISPSPAQVASVHQSLPDFSGPDGVGGYTVKKKDSTSGNSGLGPGMARTSLSTYKVDPDFENEITNTTDFDGNFLQRTRLYKNVSIDRLSEATRISRPYLMAVETGDFKNLPAAVFVRGFVVQIARILGLDEAKVANSYMKIFRAGGGK